MADYIGARYVIKVYQNSLVPGSAEWENGFSYEPLTLVTRNNSSYLSKVPVPATAGAPENEPSYWALTGAYNGQILQLQNDVTALQAETANIHGKFLSKGETVFTAEADGTKTIGDLISELVTQVSSFVANKVYRFIQLNVEGNMCNPQLNQMINGGFYPARFYYSLLNAGNVIVCETFLDPTPYFVANVAGTSTDYTSTIATVNAYLLVETFEYVA